jgi:hypothetical protein
VYNPELSFIADAPAMLATLNTPLARRDSLQLPHELFGPQIDVNFWKTPLHHDPFVYSGHVFNLRVDSIDPIQELEAEIQSSIDCLSICGDCTQPQLVKISEFFVHYGVQLQFET